MIKATRPRRFAIMAIWLVRCVIRNANPPKRFFIIVVMGFSMKQRLAMMPISFREMAAALLVRLKLAFRAMAPFARRFVAMVSS